MDEQRLTAYLELIQALLECPSGTVNDILNANRDLVDANFVQVMEVVAANMAEKGNSNAAWLQNLAAHLANYVSSTATPQEYFSFLIEVLQATSDSGGEPQVVYGILQQKLDKLDLKFAQILQVWATSKFTEITSEDAAPIAGVIVNFGNLINQFPLGSRAGNLEIGIACYSAASEVYTREDYPEQWATVQNNLGNTYRDRIEGVRATNIEEAIACYQEALKVSTREDYPENWAMTQNNLGAAYGDRIEGVMAANIEEAIACFREALTVRTRENYPEQWATVQNNLGNAYRDRIEGVRATNIEEAIACFRLALDVYTREDYPEDWAMTQNNLGTAYGDREGVRAKNIEDAIACFREALKVCSLD
jgi:tetratricopeptide (TPR) repeat protein